MYVVIVWPGLVWCNPTLVHVRLYHSRPPHAFMKPYVCWRCCRCSLIASNCISSTAPESSKALFRCALHCFALHCFTLVVYRFAFYQYVCCTVLYCFWTVLPGCIFFILFRFALVVCCCVLLCLFCFVFALLCYTLPPPANLGPTRPGCSWQFRYVLIAIANVIYMGANMYTLYTCTVSTRACTHAQHSTLSTEQHNTSEHSRA